MSCLTKPTGLRRNSIDRYYTKQGVADLCLNHVKNYVDINERDLIIEPSAGDGSFINGIKSMTSTFRFYDIDPKHDDIIKKDYISYVHEKSELTTHVIGNPPFGRQSSLAIQFIKKSCEFCDTLSFILPRSFKKDSLKRTFPLEFHLIFECDLPERSFLVNNVEHDVPCVFQIWKRHSYNRQVTDRVEPHKFKFVSKHENPDISFRRVGVYAGKIDTDIESKSQQSHYFITFTNDKSVNQTIENLSTITYDMDNTVGPRSISKQELIQKFNQYV